MKKAISPILIIFFFTFLSHQGFNQSVEVTGINGKEFKGVRSIVDNRSGEVQGYYCYYISEKQQGKTEFVLAIFNKSLKLLRQTPVVMTSGSEINGGVYNGESFLFSFMDFKKKTLSYIAIDTTGMLLNTKSIEEENYSEAKSDILPAQNGFLIIKPIQEKKLGYSVEKISNNLSSVWEKQFVVDAGEAKIDQIFVTEGKIIIIEIYKPIRISNKATTRLIYMDELTGREIFSLPLTKYNQIFLPTAFLIDKDKNIVCAGVYVEGTEIKARSYDGLFIMKFNKNGQEEFVTKEKWEDGMNKSLLSKMNKVKGKKPKVNGVYIHTITENENSYSLIGETYCFRSGNFKFGFKNIANGRILGTHINTSSACTMDFEVLDFVNFNYSKDGKLNKLCIIEKFHSIVICIDPYCPMGNRKIASFMKKYGFFDYAFTMQLKEKPGNYIVGYNISEKPHFTITSVDAENNSTTKIIPINTAVIRAGHVGVLKNEDGKVVVFIHNAEEESLVLYTVDIVI